MEKTQDTNTDAQKWRQYRRSQRRIRQIGGCLTLSLFLALAVVASAFNRKNKERGEDNNTIATLIDKRESVGLYEYNAVLFYDLDGDTNTAETIGFVLTRKAAAMEQLRHVKVGQAKTIRQWKADLKVITPQLNWEDINQRQ